MPLGNEYEILEKIRLTGQRYYFDTGFKPNQNTRTVMTYENAGTKAYFFGCWNSDYNKGAYAVGNDTGNVYAGYDGQGGGFGEIQTDATKVELDRNVVKFDDTEFKTFDASTFQLSYNMYLFAQNRKGTASWGSVDNDLTFKSCQIYDNDILIRDYVPVVHTGTRLAYLYDSVNDTVSQIAGDLVILNEEIPFEEYTEGYYLWRAKLQVKGNTDEEGEWTDLDDKPFTIPKFSKAYDFVENRTVSKSVPYGLENYSDIELVEDLNTNYVNSVDYLPVMTRKDSTISNYNRNRFLNNDKLLTNTYKRVLASGERWRILFETTGNYIENYYVQYQEGSGTTKCAFYKADGTLLGRTNFIGGGELSFYSIVVDKMSTIGKATADTEFKRVFLQFKNFGTNSTTVVFKNYVDDIEKDTPLEDSIVKKFFSITPADEIHGVEPPEPPQPEDDNPLEKGGETEKAHGGKGTWDKISDIIPVPVNPSVSAINAGFISLYNPTLSELNSLASFIWSNDFVDVIKKLFGNPIDVILGIGVVPVKPITSGRGNIRAGFIDTGVSSEKISNQFVSYDCGNLFIGNYSDSFYDYSPFTKYKIYLPFCSEYEIDADKINNKTINLKYIINVLDGTCVAILSDVETGDILYQFTGNCLMTIPYTSQSFDRLIQTGVNIVAGSVGKTIAGGIGAGVGALAESALGNITNMKPDYTANNTSSGSAGYMSYLTPYITMTVPRQAMPAGYKSLKGFRSNLFVKIGDVAGYSEFDSFHLVNMSCSSAEYDEIVELLKGGVIVQ